MGSRKKIKNWWENCAQKRCSKFFVIGCTEKPLKNRKNPFNTAKNR